MDAEKIRRSRGVAMKSPIEIFRQPRPGDHCLICGDKPKFIGVYIPGNSQLYGAPAGKTRFVRYCLCEKCQSKNETPENVEKVLFSDLTGGEVNHV